MYICMQFSISIIILQKISLLFPLVLSVFTFLKNSPR